MDIGRNDPCYCGSGKKYKKCCINKEEVSSLPVDHEDEFPAIDSLLDQGYSFFDKNKQCDASDIWVEAWSKVLEWVTLKDMKDIQKVDKYKGRQSEKHLLFNWIQDFELALENAGRDDKRYTQMRYDVSNQFRHHFPESDSLILFNMGTAAAESLFLMGEVSKGERLFEQVIKENPENPWGYIRWGDVYNSLIFPELPNGDKEKAISLYNRGMEVATDKYDIEGAEERLEELTQ